MDIEVIKASYNEALERMSLIGAELDAATTEDFDEINARFIESETEVRTLGERIESLEKIASARAAHKPAALAPVEARTVQVTEEAVYRIDQGGYFADMAAAKAGDTQARERLEKHQRQTEERAGIKTGTTAAGEFSPPQWTVELYAAYLRAGRPFADQCINYGAPTRSTWSLPRITTGATAAVQTETAAVDNTDQVTDSVSADVQTVAGRTVASYQLMDLAEPGMDRVIYSDLLSALNQKYDNALLNGTVTNAKGVLQVSGINTVTYTSATPTGAGIWPSFFQGKSAIEKGVFRGVDFIVMHPSQWNFILASLDSNNRPLALSTTGAAFNAMAAYNDNPQGLAGNVAGIPVIVDANVPVNLGVSTNQSIILMASRQDLLVREGAPVFKLADQTSVTSLNWNFVLYMYYQAMFTRHAKSFSTIGGTGLVVQSGY